MEAELRSDFVFGPSPKDLKSILYGDTSAYREHSVDS